MSEQVIIATPATVSQQRAAETLAQRSAAITIDDAESHGEAIILLQDMKAWMKGVRGLLSESIDLANRTHKSLTGLRSKLIGPVESLYEMVAGQALKWEREEQARADDEARIEAEKQRQAEEEAALQEATAAQEAGDHEAAEEIVAAQAEAPLPVVESRPQVSKVAGAHNVGRWKAELVSPIAALRYIIDNPQYINVVEFDQSKMDGLARAQREAFTFGGFRAVKKVSKTIRS